MFDFVRSPKFPYLSVFLVGVVLRGIPELLVSWYPVGYETITYYAPAMMSFSAKSLAEVFMDRFSRGLIFYSMMWFIYNVSGADVYLILKILGPVLYGSLVVSFFLFLKKGLKCDDKMAFIGALICAFQPVALRLSWDRFVNVSGLTTLFLTLAVLRSNFKWKWPLVVILAVVTTLSRELIAAVLLVTIGGYAVLEKGDRRRLLMLLLPLSLIFALMVSPYFGVQLIPKGSPDRIMYVSVEGISLVPIMANFLPEGLTWASYLRLLQNVFLLFVFSFLPVLPLLMKGFWRDNVLDPMLACLVFGSFSLIASPLVAVPGYQRWMMMLVFPFTAYFVNGLRSLHLMNANRVRALSLIVLIFGAVGLGYSTGAFSYMQNNIVNAWIPGSLVASSVGVDQIDDVIKCLEWLNVQAVKDSVLIIEERFRGWALIYLNDDFNLLLYPAPGTESIWKVTYGNYLNLALQTALENDFGSVYFLWYTGSELEYFETVFSQGAISVFQYAG